MAWPLLLVGGATALAKRLTASAIVAGVVSGITYMFKTKLGLFIMAAMIWLGINFATIKIVLEPAIDLLLGYADGGLGGGEFAPTAIAWMGVLQFDRAITMVVSAIVTKHVVMQGRLYLFKRGFGATP
ncbi:DUF2523 family protein [Luteimonas saliphila]|uniref:DUF2523 family protein n=1 Tax=Luteimonas saliphila TaxID=2804919 RepID=UPI00192DDC6A|nr:DUF2523 family protein [Luteimonas saliphila]